MINGKKALYLITIFLLLILAGCSASSPGETPPSSAQLEPTEVPPTFTPLPPTEEPEPSPTPWQEHSGSGGGVLAFISDRNGMPVVFLMNADGSDQRALTNEYEAHPDWSPDGSSLAYDSRREPIAAIYSYDLATQVEKQLTFTDRSTFAADWSPDGTKMVLIHTPTHPGINYEVFLMNADGKSLKPLTDSVEYQYHTNPDWSPDGSRIAYAVDIDDTYNIYLMDPDGTDVVQLTTGDGKNNKPAWSPDGTKIAFESKRDGNWEIYVMDADGSNLVRLTDHPEDDKWPCWSPDGTRIAFQSDRDGNWEIYLMNADGSDPQRLTENEAKDNEPAWRPVN